jgi:hypothetical protein
MKNSKDLKVRFTVVRAEGLGGRKYFFSNGEGDGQILLSNFPPFFELVGSRVSVTTSRYFGDRPTSCSIIARELPQIPRDPIVKSCFSERIAGSFWPRSTIEATEFDEGGYLRVKITEKSGIVTYEKFRIFLSLKHYAMTNDPFSKEHQSFEKKMKKMGKKSITEKDVLEHFDFPEILSFPW